MHFGTPVVPLEYTIRKGSRKATRSNTKSSSPFAASTKLSNVTVFSNPSKLAAFPGNLGCVTTPLNSSTLPIPSTISSIFSLKSTVFPLYTAASSTNTYLGLICTNRSRIPFVPISVLLLLNNPPELTIAINVIKVSKLVLATTATLSPFFTPLARSAFASSPTLFRRSPQVWCRISVFPSLISVSAILLSSLCCVVRIEGSEGEAEKRMFSAKFMYVPLNQCGMLSMGRDVSMTCL
jgi:hypothetical protein